MKTCAFFKEPSSLHIQSRPWYAIEVFGANFREFLIRRVVLENENEILYSFELFIAVVFFLNRQKVDKPSYADTNHKFCDRIMKKYANLRFTLLCTKKNSDFFRAFCFCSSFIRHFLVFYVNFMSFHNFSLSLSVFNTCSARHGEG